MNDQSSKMSKESLFELFDQDTNRVKNLDLLYNNLSVLKMYLQEKREDARDVGDHKLENYLKGQIVGIDYAKSIMDAFFDY